MLLSEGEDIFALVFYYQDYSLLLWTLSLNSVSFVFEAGYHVAQVGLEITI